MIELVKEKKPKKPSKPYYILKYNYMIGDADGNTSEEVELSADNPFVERYCKLLNSLGAAKGRWGVMLESGKLNDHLDVKQITEDDYNFLYRTMFPEDIEDDEVEIVNYFKTKEENKWGNEFFEGVRSEAEYSFLVFEGVELFYVDEYKKKHKTKIK